MNLKIVGLQTHKDESPLAFTVMFDDLDRARCFVVTVTESAFFDPAAHPFCEGIDIELEAEGKIRIEKYDTVALIQIIEKFIRDKVSD